MRRSIADILKTEKVDLFNEYCRLYELFYHYRKALNSPLFLECDRSFLNVPFRGTCISLHDFNRTHEFFFSEQPKDFDLNYLITFCEYTYNLILYLDGDLSGSNRILYMDQIMQVLDLINYEFIHDEDVNVEILVPRNQEAVAVAEIVDEAIAYSVLEYNHHSVQGNLAKKKAILKLMADDIELQRKLLNGINRTLADNLFQMLQKFVRHNNADNPHINNLSPQELEDNYDDIYQMWLLAKLELDNLDRKKRVEATLQKING